MQNANKTINIANALCTAHRVHSMNVYRYATLRDDLIALVGSTSGFMVENECDLVLPKLSIHISKAKTIRASDFPNTTCALSTKNCLYLHSVHTHKHSFRRINKYKNFGLFYNSFSLFFSPGKLLFCCWTGF